MGADSAPVQGRGNSCIPNKRMNPNCPASQLWLRGHTGGSEATERETGDLFMTPQLHLASHVLRLPETLLAVPTSSYQSPVVTI